MAGVLNGAEDDMRFRALSFLFYRSTSHIHLLAFLYFISSGEQQLYSIWKLAMALPAD
jgi:hypothetical protein